MNGGETESDNEWKKKIESRIGKLENEFKENLSSKHKSFPEAINYIKENKFVPLINLRNKFPSLSNSLILEKFNMIFSDNIAVFSSKKKKTSRFYVYCENKFDVLYEFSLEWNKALEWSVPVLSLNNLRNKDIEIITEFVQKYFGDVCTVNGKSIVFI